MANYDAWKADAPSPGTGQMDVDATRRNLFWNAYRVAVRFRCVESWLAEYRQMPIFAELVALADRCTCGICETPVYPDEDLCPTCRHNDAMRSGEHHAA